MRNFMELFVVLSTVLFASNAYATPDVEVTSALHRGSWGPDGVEWTSRFEPEFVDAGPDGVRLPFAIALPAGTILQGEGGTQVAPIHNARGELTAVLLRGPHGRVSTALTASVPHGGVVDPPLAVGVVQRIEIEGARVNPPAGSPLQLRLADVRHTRLGTADRWRLARRWGRSEVPRPAIVLADASFVAAGGFTACLQQEGSDGALAVLGGVFAAVVGGLGVALWLGRRRVRQEEATAFLKEHEPDLWELG